MRTILVVLALVLLGPAHRAADRDVEITPSLGLRGGATLEPKVTGEGRAQADPSLSYGVIVDFPVRPDARVEIFFDRQELAFEADPAQFGAERFDITIDYLQAGGVYEPRRDKARPFVAAALGLTRFDARGATVDDSVGLSGSIAGGVKIPMGSRVALRFELRGYATFQDLALQASCGPGCLVSFTAGGWYQVTGRLGIAIRL
jgi:hypothetical protein